MSSILDALRKLEEPAPSSTGGRPGGAKRRRTAPLAVLAIVVAFVAGVGAAFWYRGTTPPARETPAPAGAVAEQAPVATPAAARPADEPAPTPTPAAVTPPAAPPATAPAAEPPVVAAPAPPPASAPPAALVPARSEPPAPPATNVVAALAPAPPAPPPLPSDVSELPRARIIDTSTPPARRPEPAAEPTAVRTAEPPVETTAVHPAEMHVDDAAVRAPEPPVETAAVRPPTPPTPPADDAVSTQTPAGAPQITINFLAWSRTPDRRTVTLTIGDAGMVTLHEGESASDFEVARILPDRVHVRWGGRLYAVRATP